MISGSNPEQPPLLYWIFARILPPKDISVFQGIVLSQKSAVFKVFVVVRNVLFFSVRFFIFR